MLEIVKPMQKLQIDLYIWEGILRFLIWWCGRGSAFTMPWGGSSKITIGPESNEEPLENLMDAH